MTKLEIMTMTRHLLQREGVQDYVIGFNNNRGRIGVCRYDKRSVEFSNHFLPHMSRSQIIDVIRHEVAHAAVGPGLGHGATWRRKFMALGGSGEATGNLKLSAETRASMSKYVIKCAVTDEIIAYRHRQRKGGWSCLCHRQKVNVITNY